MTVMVYPVTADLERPAIDGRVITPRTELAVRITAEWRDLLTGNTRAAYLADLALWHQWCRRQGTDPLDARKPDADRWIASQLGDGLAKRTVARRVSAVASWYEFLRDSTAGTPVPLAAENPARTRRRPKVSRDDTPTIGLSKAQCRQLILAAADDSPRSGALIRFLLGNGLRVGTAVSARIEDMTEDDGHRVILLTGKGDVRRSRWTTIELV